jgi:DNA-directed RNA polymerase specialized sigma24 family protein
MLTPFVPARRERHSGRRAATPARPAATAGRRRIAEALARRGVRERLLLSLLLVERLRPAEVADALGISVPQVERSYRTLMGGLRRSLVRPVARRRGAGSLRRVA